ncbi:hypothetical protein Mp_8g04530 [Marchantia polymorpha subsp. ruderalis]|uniref:Uncharacterized protein n=1 Tax=Marchantia polymorpha TaxID=3197 RepID=A0A2R6W1H6_MARPO|nr:hypothetical protein MARPO_0186s0004 [Marchantia polymorpha]BBN18680.1 hypothetical protein Mp_8g04530 [Marchantia polymorpha subsp. ruderalis]|eukprot:PTQ27703.1 hypothetical protein MARPO_0186s0004 [Marchantia polymorpha]
MGATSVGSPPSIRLDVLSVGLSARQSLSLGSGVLTPYYRQLTKLRPWPCLSMQVMVFILHCANWEWDGYGHGWTLFGNRGPCEIVFRESAVCTCNNAGSVVSSYADHGFDSLQTETRAGMEPGFVPYYYAWAYNRCEGNALEPSSRRCSTSLSCIDVFKLMNIFSQLAVVVCKYDFEHITSVNQAKTLEMTFIIPSNTNMRPSADWHSLNVAPSKATSLWSKCSRSDKRITAQPG